MYKFPFLYTLANPTFVNIGYSTSKAIGKIVQENQKYIVKTELTIFRHDRPKMIYHEIRRELRECNNDNLTPYQQVEVAKEICKKNKAIELYHCFLFGKHILLPWETDTYL